MKSKKSVWMRIPVFIVSGIILKVWLCFILIFALVQFILLLVGKKKEKEFLNISGMFSEQVYCFFRYIAFVSEEKPFPFSELKKRKR